MTPIELNILNAISNKSNYSNTNTSYRIYDNLGQLRVRGSLIFIVYYIENRIVNIEVTIKDTKNNPLILSRLSLLNYLDYNIAA